MTFAVPESLLNRIFCIPFITLMAVFSVALITENAWAKDCLAGDSNLDGRFETEDLVLTFQHGHYYSGSGRIPEAYWESGDWSGDGIFDEHDLNLALREERVPCNGIEAARALAAHQDTLRLQANRFSQLLRIEPFADDVEALIRSRDLPSDKAQELRFYHQYTETMRVIAAYVTNSSLPQTGSRAGMSFSSSGVSYDESFFRSSIEQGYPLPDLSTIQILAFMHSQPTIVQKDFHDVLAALADVLNSLGSNPDAVLRNRIARMPSQQIEYLRAMRAANMQTLLAQRNFPVFNNLNFRGMPDVGQRENLLPARLLTSWWFFPYDSESSRYVEMERVHPELIRSRTRRLQGGEKQLHVIDIEHWKLTDLWPNMETTYTQNVEKLAQVIDIMHEENPGLLLCFYSMLPQRDLSAAYQGPDSTRYQDWQRHNLEVARILGPRVDAICPSLYTVHVEQERFPIYAYENAQQARLASMMTRPDLPADVPRYKRPVIGYTWPLYHSNGGHSPKAGQPIEGEFYHAQLSLFSENLDGLVMWSGSSSWDESWAESGGEYSWYEAFHDWHGSLNH